MARIDAAYHYFLTTYGKNLGNDRYDSHKASELAAVYNRVIKANKNSPLYKIDMSGDVKNFAIDLKENARQMQNVVSAITPDGADIESIFYKKIATSSNEDAVRVNYVGDDDSSTQSESSTFTVGVEKLAEPQINTGSDLESSARGFEEGSYSFDLDTNTRSYEFQFNVAYGDTNLDVQQKIVRLVNTSDVGLNAEVIPGRRNGTSALQITSRQTGLAENEDYLFRIQSGSSWNEVNRLGIANVSQPASSSVFTLNGVEHTSLSNTFTINREFELTLTGTTPADEPAVIGFKANTDAIADSVDELLTSYNGFVAVGQKYQTGHSNNQLLNEISGIRERLSDELSAVGISSSESGRLSLDREKLAEAVTGPDASTAYSTLNRFRDALSKEANKTAVNPLNYVDKVTVEYKNPGKTFAAPYAASIYSGLLMDTSL